MCIYSDLRASARKFPDMDVDLEKINKRRQIFIILTVPTSGITLAVNKNIITSTLHHNIFDSNS